MLTLATYSYQTSSVGYSGGHPAAIFRSYGYPLLFYNDTHLDASSVSYHQLNVLFGVVDFLLFFALSGSALAVSFAVHGRSKLTSEHGGALV